MDRKGQSSRTELGGTPTMEIIPVLLLNKIETLIHSSLSIDEVLSSILHCQIPCRHTTVFTCVSCHTAVEY